MSERKRVETKPVVVVAPPPPRVRQREPNPEIPKVDIKKEVQVKEPERKRVSGEIPIAEAPKVEAKPRAKTVVDKHIRFSLEDMRDDNTINLINKQTINGDIKYAYYATDNDIGYYYYLVIKK